MLGAAKQTGKLLQIGHQRRSNPRYIHCYEKLIKEFELFGQIVAVNGQWNRSASEPLGWPEKAPIDQATLTKYGFKSMHQFRNWRWYKGLGGGPIVDLGSHQIDVYNWFLEAMPKNVMASGKINYYDKKTHEWYDTVMAIYEYEASQGAVTAFYQTITSNSNNGYYERFMGDQGTLIISEYSNRNKIYPESRSVDGQNWLECIKKGDLAAPEEIMKTIDTLTLDDLARIFFVDETPDLPKLDPSDPDLPVTVNRPCLNLPIEMHKLIHQPHLENFFDAIRGKATLNCPAKIGYETAITVLKVNEAAETGLKLEFKPEEFSV
jgi:hypothetical protein